ncbi:proton channel OtopLc-like isoform X2 [Amphibalanus amphitrite]|uniref:proton channel OtopLc-like isoform X2 n=1 Tax=Amphibalanus amphitrite TaxID=1232801 RepID=UPI001C90694C|nr:proton channel OtopLc-like isoform X2 [Amphibalanus amphitrite]
MDTSVDSDKKESLEDSSSSSSNSWPVKNSKTASFRVLSLVYAKLLVVVCIAFLISEIVTTNVPLHYYEGFFAYMYGGSILFLSYVFVYLLREPSGRTGAAGSRDCNTLFWNKWRSRGSPVEVSLNNINGSHAETRGASVARLRKARTSDNDHSHGGFFLRVGAIAFGLGAMVYNGLELGSYFELPNDSDCRKILLAVNPCLQATFTFMQMYFIFANPKLNIHKLKLVARFGLMHVVATNVCVWVRTLVRESLRVFVEYAEEGERHGDEDHSGEREDHEAIEDFSSFVRTYGFRFTGVASVAGRRGNQTCGRVNIMGSIVSDASPYLFPLIIEYSLIGATVLFVMWRHVGRCPRYVSTDSDDRSSAGERRPTAGKVDCVGVSKGLFAGLLVVAAIVISLVLFFVLVGRDDHRRLAILLADTSHATILVLMVFTCLAGFIKCRQLKFAYDKPDDLDTILLRISGFGLFLYSTFCLIAAALSPQKNVSSVLLLITSLLVVIQVLAQLVFISDVMKRSVYLPEHDRTKPGRQLVTFLLLCNLALWVVYTMEIDKVDANPVQLHFYGPLPWAVILRATLPLAIFHRFHSTVVLAEVWKSSYRLQ